MKKKILWISPHIPYDTVAHGGGKTHNYYIKYFQKTGKFQIALLSLCMKEETERIDLREYNIRYQAQILDGKAVLNIFRRLADRVSYANPWDKYAGICLNYERWAMNRQITDFMKKGFTPDIIILQWTFAVLYAKKMREVYPDSKIVAIEEDVTFLNYQRRAESTEHGWVNRMFWKKRACIGKKIELSALKRADLIVTNNYKDTELLEKQGIANESIFTSAPYFDDYSCVKRYKASRDILFWGSMSRPENYQSAIWFIKWVMPLLGDLDIRFLVAGGNPNPSLKRYTGERVIVTGYVENPAELFENCLCMAAPLVGGAGIKIKILEAMSAGIPVLTNEIGIEGIPAENGAEYYFCKTPDDYERRIRDLLENREKASGLGEAAREFIRKKYSLPRKLDKLIEKLFAEGH